MVAVTFSPRLLIFLFSHIHIESILLQGTVTDDNSDAKILAINITQILQGTVTSKTLYNNYIIFAIICYNYDGDKLYAFLFI